MISDAEELEQDLIAFLRKYGGWFDSRCIGLEMGFDPDVASSRVRGVLTKLIKRGIVEQYKQQKPIIYRAKQQLK